MPRGADASLPDRCRSFCECNYCQRHTEIVHEGPSPEMTSNGVIVSHLPPGVETNQTLCLRHWTFIRMQTHPAGKAQSYYDADVSEAGSISAGGAEAGTGYTLLLTMDTDYKDLYQRFTTVDAFVYKSATLPAAYLEVNNLDGEYPSAVFTDATLLTSFDLRDS